MYKQTESGYNRGETESEYKCPQCGHVDTVRFTTDRLAGVIAFTCHECHKVGEPEDFAPADITGINR